MGMTTSELQSITGQRHQVVEACRLDGYDNFAWKLYQCSVSVVEACRLDGYDNTKGCRLEKPSGTLSVISMS